MGPPQTLSGAWYLLRMPGEETRRHSAEVREIDGDQIRVAFDGATSLRTVPADLVEASPRTGCLWTEGDRVLALVPINDDEEEGSDQRRTGHRVASSDGRQLATREGLSGRKLGVEGHSRSW